MFRFHITYKVNEKDIWTTGVNITTQRESIEDAIAVFRENYPKARILAVLLCD